MRIRVRAQLTLAQAQYARKLLLEDLAKESLGAVGGMLNLNTAIVYKRLGRWELLEEILATEDKR